MRHIGEWLRTSPKQERWGVLPRCPDPAPGLLCFYWQKSRSWRLCACGWHLQHPNMRPLRKRMQSSQEMSHGFFMNFRHAEIPQEEHIALADNVLACFAWYSMGTCSLSSCMMRIKKNWTRPWFCPTWIWVDYHNLDSSCVIYFLPIPQSLIIHCMLWLCDLI